MPDVRTITLDLNSIAAEEIIKKARKCGINKFDDDEILRMALLLESEPRNYTVHDWLACFEDNYIMAKVVSLAEKLDMELGDAVRTLLFYAIERLEEDDEDDK